MTEHFIRETLLPVIRAGMGLDASAATIGEDEFRELKAVGVRQDILPVVGAGLKKIDPRPEWERELRSELMVYVYRYVVRDHSLKQIGGALDSIGVPHVPLKGATLQYLYPEPWMRTSGDIDVLVPEEDLERAVAAIEKDAEFKFIRRNYHDVLMLSARVCLELHFSIKERMENIDGLLSKVWEYAVPTDDGSRRALTPEFQVFHTVAHMSYHMVHSGLGIRPFLDLWLLKEKTRFDEAVLRKMCDDCGILRFYDVACDLLRVWMNDAPCDGVVEALERFCLNGGVFGSLENGANQRKRRGLAYLWGRLFVGRDVLEETYPSLKKRPRLILFYQARRWLRLLDPEKRKSAITEIKLLKTVGKETIDSFDQLLTSMGL